MQGCAAVVASKQARARTRGSGGCHATRAPRASRSPCCALKVCIPGTVCSGAPPFLPVLACRREGGTGPADMCWTCRLGPPRGPVQFFFCGARSMPGRRCAGPSQPTGSWQRPASQGQASNMRWGRAVVPSSARVSSLVATAPSGPRECLDHGLACLPLRCCGLRRAGWRRVRHSVAERVCRQSQASSNCK